MKRVLFGCVVLGAVAVAACASDPTSEISGTPTRISKSLSVVNLAAGDSTVVTAETRDAQNVALTTLPTFASADAAVATVRDAYLPPLAQARFFVKGVAAGATVVRLSADGISDSVIVNVN
ncbi:MAG: hypothetical protein OER21_11585 [Gemmatimonadota bacterium]|nr:hypothetical protein [Gemmatimonadota bacterium]